MPRIPQGDRGATPVLVRSLQTWRATASRRDTEASRRGPQGVDGVAPCTHGITMSDDVRVTPEAWNARGEAVVRAPSGKPLMVFGGIPGESGVVWVQHKGRNQSVGLWRDSDHPHPQRVQPPCDKVSACGGCPVMHVSPEGQWGARMQLVRDALDEHGLPDVKVGARHASPDGELGYRHVVKLGAGYSDQGSLRVGAWGRRTRTIVPIPQCPVTTDTLRACMSAVAHHVIALNIRPYDAEADSGVLRAVVLRQSRTTGEVLITLVVGRRIRPLRDLAEAVANDVSDVAGIWVHTNDDPGNAIFKRDEWGAVQVRPLIGKAWIEEAIGGISYRMGPGDFFQTNPAMAEVLYARALDALQVERGTPVVDLYAGVGGLALQASRRSGWALGVETVEGAVGHARESARRNDLTAEFICEDVIHAMPDVQKKLGDRRPVVVLNPARRGLEEGVIDEVVKLDPRRIGYISCNPRALARDLALFREHGYDIGEIELFDMFPNTPHVEALVVLHGKQTDGPERRAPRRKVVRRS